MRARSGNDGSLVYSSDPRALRPGPSVGAKPGAKPGAAPNDGVVRIWLEKKGRNGTPVSILRGLPNDRQALAELAARLKRACGTGGSVKDGEIIIQGDHRDRIATLLERDGHRVKLAGS
jgi:translation initiation factor 1